MPLAIKLAAAWADTLPIADIETELRAGLEILEGQAHDAPQRHQSIEAVFDSSWTRRSAQEQGVFMRLSVFREGFTRDAAKAVAGASLRDLQHLVHSAFLQLLPSGRYAVHELMRQYGEHKLAASGELTVIEESHAQFFADFIAPLASAGYGMAPREMSDLATADFENIRAAWNCQAERRNIAELRRLLDGIWFFLDGWSRSQEGIDLLEPLLTVFPAESDDERLFRGQLLARLAWYYSDTGQHLKALETARQAQQILEPYNSADDLLFLLDLVVTVHYFMNREQESLDELERGFKLARQHPDSKWRIQIDTHWGYYLAQRRSLEEALQWLNSLPEYTWQMFIKAYMLQQHGRYAEAEALLLKALDVYWMSPIHYAAFYASLVNSAIGIRDFDKAWRYIQRGLHYVADASLAWGALAVVTRAMQLFIAEGQYQPAAELLALVLNHPAATGEVIAEASKFEDAIKSKLSAEEFAAAWEQGQQLDLGDVITDLMER